MDHLQDAWASAVAAQRSATFEVGQSVNVKTIGGGAVSATLEGVLTATYVTDRGVVKWVVRTQSSFVHAREDQLSLRTAGKNRYTEAATDRFFDQHPELA